MKTIASILILLLFAMAFAPCGDATEIGASQQVEQISESSMADAEHLKCKTEKQEEECSPICPCQCCPSIDSDTIDLPEITSIAPSAQTTEEKKMIPSAVRFSIWSPPQLLS